MSNIAHPAHVEPATPSSATRFVLAWLNRPWGIELRPGLNRLGRNPTNDFRVSDASVSSFHCEIVLEDNAVLVRDLGSTNGTFVEGGQVTEKPLLPGQILKLGSAEFRLEETAAVAPSMPLNMSTSQGATKPIPKPAFEIAPEPVKKPSMLARLTQTLRLPFGR